MKSIRARLEALEDTSEVDGRWKCPHCRTPFAIIDKDTEDGPAFCFFCGQQIAMPTGRVIKVMIGVRDCL